MRRSALAAAFRAAAAECAQVDLLGAYAAMHLAGIGAADAGLLKDVFGDWPTRIKARDNGLRETMLLLMAEIVESNAAPWLRIGKPKGRGVIVNFARKTTQTPAGRAREISSTSRD